MARSLHHAALCIEDLDASLRFYRDGLGLAVLMDRTFDGDWPALFGAGTSTLRSVFLGNPAAPDAGVVELVVFDGGVDDPAAPGPPEAGFFLLSFFVDVDATLDRLRGLGFPGRARGASSSPARTGRSRWRRCATPTASSLSFVGVTRADA